MKKRIIVALVVLTMLILSIALAACSQKKSIYDGLDNLASNATYYNKDGDTISSFKMTDKVGLANSVTVDLGSVKTFNTIILKESTESIKKFYIFASNTNGSDYELIHTGDTIEKLRVCYVSNKSFRYIRIMIADHSGSYKLSKIGVYNKKVTDDTQLRVTGYLVMDKFDATSDLSMLQGLTDIILFSMANFDVKGNITFSRYDSATDKSIDVGLDGYKAQVKIVRDALGGRDVNLIADIHLPYNSDSGSIIDLLSSGKTTAIANITKLLQECNLDGYAIDYEYPYKGSEWKIYSQFLVDVKSALGDKLLCVATAGWANRFSKAAIAAIDRVELMTYDLMDKHGYHASFYNTAVTELNKLLKVGFKKEQIDFGLPFYSRPLDGHGYWGSFNEVSEKLGKYEFLDTGAIKDHDGNPLVSPRYFNSPAMIADKTAYALDLGLGGMMIWHMTCDVNYDNNLSLTKTIINTIAEKKLP